MAELPYLFQHIAKELRGFARDVCDRMQAHFKKHGYATSSWRFDAVPGTDNTVQLLVEFLYEHGNARRRVFFLGPSFAGMAGADPPFLATSMRPEIVRDWLRAVYDCRHALTTAMGNGDILGTGMVTWSYYGHDSDVLCILDGTPVPKVLDFPIEEVLPQKCFVHLVEGHDEAKEALAAAQACAAATMRHGKIAGWIGPHPPPVREQRYWAGTQARSVEETQTKIMLLLGARDKNNEPNPPPLIVLVYPDDLPTEHEAQFPDPQVEPQTGVMWANFLHNILLHRTTIVVVTSVPDIESYPNNIPALVEPWRAIAKFERVYK